MRNEYFQAGRNDTPEKTLELLALSPCAKVRARVAENRQTPTQILETLSQDKNADVRIGLGYNVKTPVRVLWKLAMDEHLDVRFSLAENANTAPLILVWLSSDDNPYIAQRARNTMVSLSLPQSGSSSKGDITMSAKKVERALRRMLSDKERLNETDAFQVRELILQDGYLSRGEREVLKYAIDNDLLEDAAFEIFLDLILDAQAKEHQRKAIA